ncbi:MAG TPA: PIN domain-containing protein [Thermoanaerobaculia bacterium]|nr:PIN domain-containing protein [Thermoanaerobaculia bacterium]
MILVDTSVWIDVFRDASGGRKKSLNAALQDDEVILSRFYQLELLQGCRDETEWRLLKSYLSTQDYVEASSATWEQAARIYFELRRIGLTVRSPIDCCIAQLALENDLLLFHRDRDFTTIAKARPLRQLRIEWAEPGS